MGIPQVSFLAADVGPDSFNRGVQRLPKVESSPARELLLDAREVKEFEQVVESLTRFHARELADGCVTPGPAGLRRMVRYYAAHLGRGPFPPIACNAPWMSVYIGADGTVRPCFFHAPVGNVRQRSLREIMTDAMPAFRAP